ncbi:unnamed protein product, partial [Oikopleura dioica]
SKMWNDGLVIGFLSKFHTQEALSMAAQKSFYGPWTKKDLQERSFVKFIRQENSMDLTSEILKGLCKFRSVKFATEKPMECISMFSRVKAVKGSFDDQFDTKRPTNADLRRIAK